MLIYILKFSACLSVFMVFYKLFLERENMHLFKRFYLLLALLLSIGIPLITFTEYVVASSEVQPVIINDIEINTNSDYLSTILWSVYGLGVLVFGLLFFKNLTQILSKITRNTKVKSHHFTNVLLQNLVIPHTFFNYIFLNKHKFETKQIPKEVLIHEETHALQKHSLDILFIEILQVIFWFNPILYFIKKDIKLNHEFLADQAVLNNGFDTSAYQNTLLTFSSPDSYRDARTNQLTNAINYSLIKKRFTVMKTQTSKKRIWLRSILLLPILAILLFSFSTKVTVLEEKHNLTEIEKIVLQEIASKKQVKEYNTLARKYNEQPEAKRVIKLKDVKRLEFLYGLMNEAQKKNAEPFPNCPPPPAPDAPDAPKVIKVKELPPPPPIPENATTEEKKKYQKAVKNYKLKTQKVELLKIKERELIKVRELRAEDRKQLQEAKLVYREAQVAARTEKIKAEKGELIKVRELQAVENRNQLQVAKLAYSEAQVAARVEKVKAEKGELVRVRELQSVENQNQLQESKLAYKEAQIAARTQKIKAEKEQLKKDKKAYKEAHRKEKATKKKSDNKENE